jgi:hypothetical protein
MAFAVRIALTSRTSPAALAAAMFSWRHCGHHVERTS